MLISILVRARSELSALQGQLGQLAKGQSEDGAFIVKSKAPEVGLEYIRAMRDVKYNETLFEILAKQYEMARMDEAGQGALIQVIDPVMVGANMLDRTSRKSEMKQ